jgi:hypothetical protein
MSQLPKSGKNAAPSTISAEAEEPRTRLSFILKVMRGRGGLSLSVHAHMSVEWRRSYWRACTLGTLAAAGKEPHAMSTTRICQSELTAVGKLALTSTLLEELIN